MSKQPGQLQDGGTPTSNVPPPSPYPLLSHPRLPLLPAKCFPLGQWIPFPSLLALIRLLHQLLLPLTLYIYLPLLAAVCQPLPPPSIPPTSPLYSPPGKTFQCSHGLLNLFPSTLAATVLVIYSLFLTVTRPASLLPLHPMTRFVIIVLFCSLLTIFNRIHPPSPRHQTAVAQPLPGANLHVSVSLEKQAWASLRALHCLLPHNSKLLPGPPVEVLPHGHLYHIQNMDPFTISNVSLTIISPIPTTPPTHLITALLSPLPNNTPLLPYLPPLNPTRFPQTNVADPTLKQPPLCAVTIVLTNPN